MEDCPFTLRKILETLTLDLGCFPLDLGPDRPKTACLFFTYNWSIWSNYSRATYPRTPVRGPCGAWMGEWLVYVSYFEFRKLKYPFTGLIFISALPRNMSLLGKKTPYLNKFRRKPAISEFDWHFTTIHKSS